MGLPTYTHAERVELGRRGGSSTTAAKAAAARRNASAPYRNGQPRGWPLGKKRGPRKKKLASVPPAP